MDSFSVVSSLLTCVFSVLAILMLGVIKDRWKKMSSLNLPPGSMGFPLIGETIQFGRPFPSTTLGNFIEERVQRYGKIFRTHLIGTPTVVSADREFTKFVLRNDEILFARQLPSCVETLMGTDFVSPLMSVTQEFLSSSHLRSRLLGYSEQITRQVLQSWSEGVVFPLEVEAAKVSFHLMAKSILSLNLDDEVAKNLSRLYPLLTKALKSIPLNVPGTPLRKGCKAREAIMQILQKLTEERSKLKSQGKDEVFSDDKDHLSKLLEMPNVTMEKINLHIFHMIFAGNHTVTVVMCLIVYFLGTCPKAVKQLQVEHAEIIYNKKRKGESNLTWEDIKQMKFSHHVVNETLRLGNTSQSLLRKVVANIKYKGYDIPSGWNILLFFPSNHLDAEAYEEPECFNPWRWQDDDKKGKMMESFIPFGRGVHMCIGMQLARMEILVFIHHLVTMYEWELPEIDVPHVTHGICGFLNGLPIKVSSRV